MAQPTDFMPDRSPGSGPTGNGSSSGNGTLVPGVRVRITYVGQTTEWSAPPDPTTGVVIERDAEVLCLHVVIIRKPIDVDGYIAKQNRHWPNRDINSKFSGYDPDAPLRRELEAYNARLVPREERVVCVPWSQIHSVRILGVAA